MRKTAISIVATIVVGYSANATAQDQWPFTLGDFWQVTGIHLQDGGGLAYANWLATEWREEAELAKSKGWLKDYMVISNVHARANEPDVYLIRVFEDIPDAETSESRFEEYMEWQSDSLEELAEQSGNRVEFREVGSTALLQMLHFRDN